MALKNDRYVQLRTAEGPIYVRPSEVAMIGPKRRHEAYTEASPYGWRRTITLRAGTIEEILDTPENMIKLGVGR